jgi:hypothetical protein
MALQALEGKTTFLGGSRVFVESEWLEGLGAIE